MDQDTKNQIEALNSRVKVLERTPYIDRDLDNVSKNILQQTMANLILDTVWNNYYYYASTFDTLDRYTTAAAGAAQYINSQGLVLETLATTNNETSMLLEISPDLVSTKRPCRFRVSNMMSETTLVNWQANVLENKGHFPEGHSYVGVSMEDGTIYGISTNNEVSVGVTKVALQTYQANIYYKMELRYFPPNKVDFYVNDVYKGTITSNLPTHQPYYLMDIGIGTKTNATRTSQTSYFDFIQEKQSQ